MWNFNIHRQNFSALHVSYGPAEHLLRRPDNISPYH